MAADGPWKVGTEGDTAGERSSGGPPVAPGGTPSLQLISHFFAKKRMSKDKTPSGTENKLGTSAPAEPLCVSRVCPRPGDA